MALTLPPKKTNRKAPGANPNKEASASEWNLLIDGLATLDGQYAAALSTTSVYPNTAAGIAAVADGSYFNVPSAVAGEALVLYRRSGASATEVARSPAMAALEPVAYPFQPNATMLQQMRRFIVDADLSSWSGYDPAKFYSFGSFKKNAIELTLNLFSDTDGAGSGYALEFVFTTPVGWDSQSKDALKVAGPNGTSITVVPAAWLDSDDYVTEISWQKGGLSDRAFRKGFASIGKLVGVDGKIATTDTDDFLHGSYVSGETYIHPNDTTEHVGDDVWTLPACVGQRYRFGSGGGLVQRVGTAFVGAFTGKIRVARIPATTVETGDFSPAAATTIEDFPVTSGESVTDIAVSLARPAKFGPNEWLVVYAIPDSGSVGIRRWTSPLEGQPNPNGRDRFMYAMTSGTLTGWELSSWTTEWAYRSVPLRAWSNVVTHDRLAPIENAIKELRSEAPEALSIAIEGDSLTQLPSPVGGVTSWPALMSLPAGSTYSDTAVSGTQTEAMLGRMYGYQANPYTHFVVLGGINDLTYGTALADIKTHLSAMWATMAAGGAKVVAMTVTPFRGASDWTSGIQTTQDALNTWIREQAAENGYLLVDTYALLNDPANDQHLRSAHDSGDHKHLSTAGEQVIANAVQAAVTGIGYPATATSMGKPGQTGTDGAYFYVCIAENTWRRVAIAAW